MSPSNFYEAIQNKEFIAKIWNSKNNGVKHTFSPLLRGWTAIID
jgi:hypothetical protein